MPGFLKKLFKSKRPNPGKPQPIDITNLDPKRAADREELFHMVTAPDADARQVNAALTKTGDLDVIVRWYVDAPPATQTQIADWVARQTTNPKRLSQARGRLNDPQLKQVFDQLSGGATGTASPAVRVSQGPDQLERLAIEAKSSQERQQAANQIQDEAILQRLAKAAKGRDKSVYQIARQKLQVLREQAAKIAATHAEIEKLIEQCEAHARTESTQLYQARFDSLTQSWESLKEAATDDEKQRFHTAQAQCQIRCNEMAAAAAAAAGAEARALERRGTLALLRQTLEQLKQASPEQLPSVSSLDAMQKTQENRWLEATRDSQVERQEQKEYEQLMQALRQYLQAIRAYDVHRAELQALLVDAGDEQKETGENLKPRLAEIAWPEGYPMPELLAAAHKRGRSSAQATAKPDPIDVVDTSQLETALADLEQFLEKKELKPSRKLLKEAQQRSDRLPDKARRRFQGKLTLLARQVQDLQDWQGFATRPKQEALCEQMEHLAQQHLEPELKAAKIHELQEQWRELGGSSDQLLWQRFKQAADLAFEPCSEYFAARNELKAANHHKREQICDELGMFVSQVDWSLCDWRGVEKIHRKARQEWRDAKPIDFRKNRDVQRRFDELLRQIDDKLDEERARNEQAKADIVARAQALGSHEPLGEAMAEAKTLQKQWETIGITRQKQDRVLWQSFRAACDAIFARRDSQRAEQQAQDSEQLTAAEALLSQIEQQLQAPQAEQDGVAIKQNLQAFRQANLPSGQRESLSRRFQVLEKQFEESTQQAARQQQRQQWATQLHQSEGAEAEPDVLHELCVRAEILAGIESPSEDQARRMTLQVERLAAGMGQGRNFADARAEMDHLVSRWKDNAGTNPEPALLKRMESAIAALQL